MNTNEYSTCILILAELINRDSYIIIDKQNNGCHVCHLYS